MADRTAPKEVRSWGKNTQTTESQNSAQQRTQKNREIEKKNITGEKNVINTHANSFFFPNFFFLPFSLVIFLVVFTLRVVLHTRRVCAVVCEIIAEKKEKSANIGSIISSSNETHSSLGKAFSVVVGSKRWAPTVGFLHEEYACANLLGQRFACCVCARGGGRKKNSLGQNLFG